MCVESCVTDKVDKDVTASKQENNMEYNATEIKYTPFKGQEKIKQATDEILVLATDRLGMGIRNKCANGDFDYDSAIRLMRKEVGELERLLHKDPASNDVAIQLTDIIMTCVIIRAKGGMRL